MAQNIQFARDLYNSYENYKESTLTNRRFKHSNILPLIERLKNKDIFGVSKVGESAEGRDINMISVGSGSTKIFLWSQMHGDEPTATAAIFDIFNFFLAQNDFADFNNHLFEKTTIYFLPMVNPDGTELFQRRNIFEIDLNRDAVSQQTPEGKLLKEIFDSLKADFGFNLHDQGREYSVGNSFKSAAISFLAPSPDYDKTLTPVRENSMKLIIEMYKTLSEFIPGHIAKYSDEYEPRAFGDNFTKWGTSTLLLETGGWIDDREKQFLRKINFIALISAIKSIADESYTTEDLKNYSSIPDNEKLMLDLILRNLTVKNNGHDYKIDIGIDYEEKNINGAKEFYYKAQIEDLGDLSVFHGYNEIDLTGYRVEPGRTYPTVIISKETLEALKPIELFSNGYTNVILKSPGYNEEFSTFPFNIFLNELDISGEKISVESVPNLIIRKKGVVKYAIVNGFLRDLENLAESTGNSLLLK
ncbi:MAG: peptidase M14 [Ignavibacteriaceae bacterium]|nr:peptidase M14 [Ignavibacteriaceae bacterium]